MQLPARYFDGKTPVEQRVMARFDDSGLTIVTIEEGRLLDSWQHETITPAFWARTGNRVDLTSTGDARLILEGDGIKDQIEAFTGPGFFKTQSEWGIGFKISGLLAAGAAVCLILLFSLSQTIVAAFPLGWEREMGRSLAQTELVDYFSDAKICHSPAGDAALAKMTARLSEDYTLLHPLDVQVVESDMINAFALPGGYIRIFSGLIDSVDNPDTLAGVLAHEIGHVEGRHSLKSLSRTLIVVGATEAITGGTGLSTVLVDLTNLSFGRGMEEEADQFAIDRMKAVGLNPADTASFFRVVLGKEGAEVAGGEVDGEDLPEGSSLARLLSTHPLSVDRIRTLEAAASPALQPSLTAEEWQALKDICKQAD